MKHKHEKNIQLLKYPNIFARWHLFMCGKRDAKHKLLEKNNNGFWTSAFISKEISTAKADIEHEREVFYANNTDFVFKINKIELMKKNMEKRKPIDSIMPHTFHSKPSYTKITDSYTQFIMDSCLHNVLLSHEVIRSKKKEYYEDILLGFDINKLKNKSVLMRRSTAAHARATRIYDILVARLGIYWSGVGRIAKKDTRNNPVKYPVIFDEDSIWGLESVKNTIDKYFVN